MWTRDSKRSETPAQREAGKAFHPAKPKQATSDYAKDQQALHANRERLKAERLAREATIAAPLPKKPAE